MQGDPAQFDTFDVLIVPILDLLRLLQEVSWLAII